MNPTIIEDIKARKILDSRGNWTIEVDVVTRMGMGFGSAAAPSGASTGEHEVTAFPDGDVDKSLIEIEEIIIPELIGRDSAEQDIIDSILKEIDGTPSFSNIGGNAATAISLACAKAAASSYDMPLYQYLGGTMMTQLPFPLGNIIGGGAHAVGTDIQEFLALPVGAGDMETCLRTNILVYRKVKEKLRAKGKLCGKGDEGAWVADLKSEEALALLAEACSEVSGESDVEVRPCLDVAASELWDGKKKRYVYRRDRVERTREEQIEFIEGLIDEYGVYYVEDPLEENDFEGFSKIRKKALICGDDLYTTNVERIKKGIKEGSTNAVLIKVNQIGTLTDTYCAVRTAKESNQVPVISHRSGETTDESIAHLAVGYGCPIIKTGTVSGERIAKLNELLRISEELGAERAKMAKLPI
ncbi:MAG: phosphopyruvate hydratase [Methanobacteriota archaeon]|nr:MAG: phosphopyruvate hydratase [Euryarchaeota archaeon]